MKIREQWKERGWRLFTFRQAMLRLSVALVLCALIAGAYGQRVYFSFAASAAGVLLLARAWWEYCAWRDGRPLRGRKNEVPWIWRREKRKRPHRPAFLMTNDDFDDDLTPWTTAEAEDFSEAQVRLAHAFASLIASGLMILFSFLF